MGLMEWGSDGGEGQTPPSGHSSGLISFTKDSGEVRH